MKMNPKILILAVLAITVGLSQASASDSKESKLRCFSCNANLDICDGPFLDPRLKDHLVPCNGQCMKFKNPNDNDLWYRGCSNERYVGQQPSIVEDRGITFHFCDNFDGCNFF